MLLTVKQGSKAARACQIRTVLILSLISRGLTAHAVEPAPPSPASTTVQAQKSTLRAAEILTPTNGVDFSGYIGNAMVTVKKNWIAAMPAEF